MQKQRGGSVSQNWYAAGLLLACAVVYFVASSNVLASTKSANLQAHSNPFFHGDEDPTLPKSWDKAEADWWSTHNSLVSRVQASDKLKIPQDLEGKTPQLLFYGDSITEAWDGTSFGKPVKPSRMWAASEGNEIREAFSKQFGSASSFGSSAVKPPLVKSPLIDKLVFKLPRKRPFHQVLGVSGDQTHHLLWRMQNGEFPSMDGSPRIAVMMIGTNNLGRGMLSEPTVEGIIACARYILQRGGTQMHLLLSELLPRYDSHKLERLCPPRCNQSGKPFQSFMPAIQKVNAALPGVVEKLRVEFPKQLISLSSCGTIFPEKRAEEVMPDKLHPNAKGHTLWAHCLSKQLQNMTNTQWYILGDQS